MNDFPPAGDDSPQPTPQPSPRPPEPAPDILRALAARGLLSDHALIIVQGMDRAWFRTIDGADDIPFAVGEFTHEADMSDGAAVTVIACIGPEAVAALRLLTADPHVGEVVRVQDGAWWSSSHPHGCPPAGHRLPAPERAGEPSMDSDDPQVMRDLLRSGPPHLMATIGRHLGAVITELSAADQPDSPDQATLLDHAAAHREERAHHRCALDPPCVLNLLAATHDPQIWATLRTWLDVGAMRLWLDLIAQAPPGYRAPLAALIAGIAYEQQLPRWARVAARHGLADDPRPDVRAVLLDLRDLTMSGEDLDTHLEDILGPAQP